MHHRLYIFMSFILCGPCLLMYGMPVKFSQTIIHEDLNNQTRYAFSPDGQWLAYIEPNSPGVIIINDAQTGEGQQILRMLEGNPIRSLKFSADSKTLVAQTSESDLPIINNFDLGIWKFQNDEIGFANYRSFFSNDQHLITSYDISPNGRVLLVGRSNGHVSAINLGSRHLLPNYSLSEHEQRYPHSYLHQNAVSFVCFYPQAYAPYAFLSGTDHGPLVFSFSYHVTPQDCWQKAFNVCTALDDHSFVLMTKNMIAALPFVQLGVYRFHEGVLELQHLLCKKYCMSVGVDPRLRRIVALSQEQGRRIYCWDAVTKQRLAKITIIERSLKLMPGNIFVGSEGLKTVIKFLAKRGNKLLMLCLKINPSMPILSFVGDRQLGLKPSLYKPGKFVLTRESRRSANLVIKKA